MDGTTLCPHCDTRFKIEAAQLVAHQGKVRCGNCMQIFDALPNFVPDQPDPQLTLPMAEEPAAPPLPASAQPALESAPETVSATSASNGEAITVAISAPTHRVQLEEVLTPAERQIDHTLHVASDADIAEFHKIEPTLTERIAPEPPVTAANPPRNLAWLWVLLSAVAALAMLAQAAYLFRTELAAHLPGMKPALLGYCRMLSCTIPLPQNVDLMSIESSDLEVEDAAHDNKITLHALLRNRASYAQAYPDLELTLNDSQDKPLASRIFRPSDYLLDPQSTEHGLLSEHELSIKLRLDTHDLAPVGYRLTLLYTGP